jgi:hypothetical protein
MSFSKEISFRGLIDQCVRDAGNPRGVLIAVLIERSRPSIYVVGWRYDDIGRCHRRHAFDALQQAENDSQSCRRRSVNSSVLIVSSPL